MRGMEHMSQTTRTTSTNEIENQPDQPITTTEIPENARSSPKERKLSTQPAQWAIHQRSWLSMGSLFMVGMFSALGHHFYYTFLDGRSSTDRDEQESALRIGTGLSFLARASLVAAAAIAYKQSSWLRLRKRPTTIGGIDSILGALSDLSALMDVDMLRQSKMSSLFAILVWCIPLSTIVPPAALTVVSTLRQENRVDKVPEIDWTGLPCTTGGFGYWMDAGEDLYRLAAMTAYGMSVGSMVPTYPNYTYELEFFAPALKCGPVSREAQTTFSSELGGDLKQDAQMTTYKALLTSVSNESDRFSHEIWIRTPDKNITCQSWNVSYTTQIEFQNGVQSIRVLQQNELARYQKTGSYEAAIEFDPLEAFGYRSWLAAIQSIVAGELSITTGMSSYSLNATAKIAQTGLMGCPEMKSALQMYEGQVNAVPLVSDHDCRNGTLEKAVEDLSRNVTFSLFGYRNALFPSDKTDPRPLTKFFAVNVYAYSRKPLLSSYSVGIAVTLLIMLHGIYAMTVNGVIHNSDFSGIVCATRNSDLDRLTRGRCLAAEPIDKEIRRIKVQFGVVENAGVENNAIDTSDDVEMEMEMEMETQVETQVETQMETQMENENRRASSSTSTDINISINNIREAEEGRSSEQSSFLPHAAFGLEGTVRRLKKGEQLM